MKKTVILTAILLLICSFSIASADETKATYLYTDKTLVIDEPVSVHDSNVAKHGKALLQYSAYDGTWTKGSPWYQDSANRNSIEKVEFGSKVSAVNMYRWFKDCRNINSINVTNLDTSQCTSFEEAFAGMGSDLKSTVTFTGFDKLDTSEATNFKNMFNACCSEVTTSVILNLNNWDLTKAITTEGMFSKFGRKASVCKLYVQKWDVTNITDADGMFSDVGANAKTFYMNVSGWNLKNCAEMNSMFSGIGSNATTACNLGAISVKTDNNLKSFFSGAKNVKATIYVYGTVVDCSTFTPFKNTAVGDFGGVTLIAETDNLNAKSWCASAVKLYGPEGTASKGKVYQKGAIIVPEITETYKYTGKQIKPVVSVLDSGIKLTEGKDYTLTYENNTACGTGIVRITGIGDYVGQSCDREFTIEYNELPRDIKLTTDTYYYTGKAIKPVVKITGLKQGTDFKISYENNINPGEATLTVTGINTYTGTKSINFTIKEATLPKPYFSSTKYMYTGKKITPTPLFANKNITTKNYSVTYSGNTKCGKAIVIVKGRNGYTGTQSTVFNIVPKQAKISKVTSGKKMITAQFLNQSSTGVTSYQVAYKKSTEKTFRVTTVRTNSITLRGLTSKAVYNIKVKAIGSGGAGAYSTIKSVRAY